jgi:hypothetical protein
MNFKIQHRTKFHSRIKSKAKARLPSATPLRLLLLGCAQLRFDFCQERVYFVHLLLQLFQRV